MLTRVLSGAAGVEEAAALLAGGQVVALPTETVYGLGGSALDPEAAARIFEAKDRPFFDPLIVHLPSIDWLERLTTAAGDPIVQALIQRFWPGPLTLVLPRRSIVPDIVTAGLPSVAVRMSAHPLFRAVLERFGSPVAAPSANRFGRISPTAAAHVLEELGGRIPLILDGGPCALGLESTVVALEDGALRLLRAGPVAPDDLTPFAPLLPTPSNKSEVRNPKLEIPPSSPGAPSPPSIIPPLSSPGQLPSHYAPATPLHLLAHAADAETWQGPGRAALLSWSRSARPPQFTAMEVLTPRGDPREAAARLFAAMRRLDALGLDLIVAEPPPASGLGAAIIDRLRKAAVRR